MGSSLALARPRPRIREALRYRRIDGRTPAGAALVDRAVLVARVIPKISIRAVCFR